MKCTDSDVSLVLSRSQYVYENAKFSLQSFSSKQISLLLPSFHVCDRKPIFAYLHGTSVTEYSDPLKNPGTGPYLPCKTDPWSLLMLYASLNMGPPLCCVQHHFLWLLLTQKPSTHMVILSSLNSFPPLLLLISSFLPRVMLIQKPPKYLHSTFSPPPHI